MTTSTTPEIHLSEPAQAVVGIPHGLILVSGPAYSGKSKTLELFADAFGTRIHPSEVARIDFKGNTDEPGVSSLNSFMPSPIADLATAEGIADELRRKKEWSNTLVRMVCIADVWVVIIDDLPAELAQGALDLALTGKIVVVSIHATSAEQALENYADVLETNGSSNGRYLLKAATQASIWQQLVQDPETGDTVLETYGIDVSKDNSSDSF